MRNEGLFSFVLLCSIASATTEQAEVIYGADNRYDVALYPGQSLRSLAPSTAARIPKAAITIQNGLYNLPTTTLHKEMNVCISERFSTQRSAAECTGFLIAPDVLVTAGHCMQSRSDCTDNYWAFDYLYTTRALEEDQIFECQSVIKQHRSPNNDYAVIRLNKVAMGRTPYKLRSQGSIAMTENLAVIGFPSGLPLKIDDGGTVRQVNNGLNYFVANLDTYGGNSGSPVVNMQTLEVEGILVRGENDYIYDTKQGCYKSNVCPMNGCRGEDVTKITSLPLASLDLN